MLCKWNTLLPEFARVDKVELQFTWSNPTASKISDITQTWSTSSTGLKTFSTPARHSILAPSTSWTGEVSGLVGALQKHEDGITEWHGVMLHATTTNTALSTMNAARIKLTYTTRVGGDTDGDGDVDFVDFITLSSNYLESGDWEDGDFNGDGVVNFADFIILSNNYTGPREEIEGGP